ncbi:MAG: MBL fold metallo-hydrolase, partial [Mesorhizobium sp.]
EWTVADRYATDAMFDCQPQDWDTARYKILPAPAGRLLEGGDVVDLGDRAFEVIHTPGHSPGGIALFEKKTGILLSGDIIYDGPL